MGLAQKGAQLTIKILFQMILGIMLPFPKDQLGGGVKAQSTQDA